MILEDDAVLVDRFTERLSAILEELPRDFHLCSLGYSHPKKAPIFPFSGHLGIPTFLWYLTGYILSLEGARYLLNSLPINGPVDTWIGMHMLSNFSSVSVQGSIAVENVEHMSSVLTHLDYLLRESDASRNAGSVICRKKLAENLNFRCFAVLIPLCSQKVGSDSAAAMSSSNTARASWRERDTDIAYSGYSI